MKICKVCGVESTNTRTRRVGSTLVELWLPVSASEGRSSVALVDAIRNDRETIIQFPTMAAAIKKFDEFTA